MGQRIEVKFLKDYVASRGNPISGAKGQTKVFAKSDDLDLLIRDEIVEKIGIEKPTKKGKAARRETATAGPAETS